MIRILLWFDYLVSVRESKRACMDCGPFRNELQAYENKIIFFFINSIWEVLRYNDKSNMCKFPDEINIQIKTTG